MHFNVYYAFNSHFFRQHVSANATITTTYKGTNAVRCVAVTQKQLKIIIPSVKII
jgi:hypothetical protein